MKMGSFSIPSGSAASTGRPPSPLSAMRGVTATCNVTNKIDINMYFEALKQATVSDNNDQKNKRSEKRLSNSNKIESSKSPRESRNTSRRKSSRKSSDEEEREHLRSTRKLGLSFNYDLSGQVIDKHNHDTEQDDHCIISRQKSWDLSVSKMKAHTQLLNDMNNNNVSEDEYSRNENACDFSQTFSVGDFHKVKRKSPLHHAKSLDSVNELQLRHREHAMNHGKINSVAEQNRRSRRKYYRKKKHSSGKEDDIQKIHECLDRKLSLQ